MLQTWTMPSPKLEGSGIARGSIEIKDNPTAFLDEAGYSSTVATNSEFEIERYPRLGDVISATSVFEEVSAEKKTAKGTGFFLTWVITYTDQHGEVLGPAIPGAAIQAGKLMTTRLAPAISPDTEFFWNGLRQHKLLIQRCSGCGALRNPPRPMCPKCRSLAWETSNRPDAERSTAT